MNESFREGAGYQEELGEQALLRIIPLFLEVGLLTLTEGLLKMLPSSALREYYVLHPYSACTSALTKERNSTSFLIVSINTKAATLSHAYSDQSRIN